MNEDSADKTTFITREGTFRFRVVPFELTGVPTTFQRLMDLVMSGLNLEECLVYFDDIIVFSADVQSHLVRLRAVFSRLRAAGLKLKQSKCTLFRRRVGLLGHIVSEKGIETDSAKIESVVTWPVPTTVRDVRGFLGLCSYYRRFVKDFAEVAVPLHALTVKCVRFQWNDECQVAFDRLNAALTSSPILSMPMDGDVYALDTNASEQTMGAVLSQKQGEEEKLIAYASRTYSRAKQNYCTTRKELLAVVYFMKQF